MILSHWGRATHICVGKLTIIGSDNGLSLDRRQAIILTNAGILLIGHSGTNFSEILIEILIFSFKKMQLKMSFAKWRPFCLGLNVLNQGSTWAGAEAGRTRNGYCWQLLPAVVHFHHYGDVIMGTIASQITSLAIVYSAVYSGADQRKQSSASLAFVRGIHRGPVNSPRKWPVTRKMFPFDDVIMLPAVVHFHYGWSAATYLYRVNEILLSQFQML